MSRTKSEDSPLEATGPSSPDKKNQNRKQIWIDRDIQREIKLAAASQDIEIGEMVERVWEQYKRPSIFGIEDLPPLVQAVVAWMLRPPDQTTRSLIEMMAFNKSRLEKEAEARAARKK